MGWHQWTLASGVNQFVFFLGLSQGHLLSEKGRQYHNNITRHQREEVKITKDGILIDKDDIARRPQFLKTLISLLDTLTDSSTTTCEWSTWCVSPALARHWLTLRHVSVSRPPGSSSSSSSITHHNVTNHSLSPQRPLIGRSATVTPSYWSAITYLASHLLNYCMGGVWAQMENCLII